MIQILCDECKREMDVRVPPKITVLLTDGDKQAEFHFCCVDCAKKFVGSLSEVKKK